MQLPIFDLLVQKYKNKGIEISPDILKFRVDNISAWLRPQLFDLKHGPQKTSVMEPGFLVRSFPNIAPVAPAMWIEFTPQEPRFMEYDKDGVSSQGAMILQQPVSAERAAEGAKWCMTFSTFASFKGLRSLWSNVECCKAWVKEDGVLYGWTSKDKIEGDSVLDEEVITAFAALAFLHCKNTTTQEHRPSRQVARNCVRSGVPVVTYKTIIVDQRPTRHTTGQPDSEDAKRYQSFHIRRGTFAHYTAEKPLFGKPGLVGTFYHPMTTAGSKKQGTVIKDYVLKGQGS